MARPTNKVSVDRDSQIRWCRSLRWIAKQSFSRSLPVEFSKYASLITSPRIDAGICPSISFLWICVFPRHWPPNVSIPLTRCFFSLESPPIWIFSSFDCSSRSICPTMITNEPVVRMHTLSRHHRCPMPKWLVIRSKRRVFCRASYVWWWRDSVEDAHKNCRWPSMFYSRAKNVDGKLFQGDETSTSQM